MVMWSISPGGVEVLMKNEFFTVEVVEERPVQLACFIKLRLSRVLLSNIKAFLANVLKLVC